MSKTMGRPNLGHKMRGVYMNDQMWELIKEVAHKEFRSASALITAAAAKHIRSEYPEEYSRSEEKV